MNIAMARHMECGDCLRPANYEVTTSRGRRLGIFCADHAAGQVQIWNDREAEMHAAQTTLVDMSAD